MNMVSRPRENCNGGRKNAKYKMENEKNNNAVPLEGYQTVIKWLANIPCGRMIKKQL